MSRKRSKKKSASSEEEITRPSKSQLKRDMHRYQTICESLINQKPEFLDTLTLSDPLRHAIDEAKRIRSREALRRQKQFIGKLIKSADIEEIEEALNAQEVERKSQDRTFKEVESIRASLISGGNDAINAVISQFPEIDKPKLRQLTKRSRNEVSENLPANAQKQLFRFLRETYNSHNALDTDIDSDTEIDPEADFD